MPTEITVSKSFTFEASHILPNHPGKCARLHGHSWGLTVSVKGPINSKSGFVVDFYDVSTLVNRRVIDHLDHSHLGQFWALTGPEGKIKDCWKPYLGRDFYPSSENLVFAIARILQPHIKELSPHARLHTVEIRETCTSAARWCHDDSPAFPGDAPTPSERGW